MGCGWVRFRISWCLDDGRPLPGSVERHVRCCRRCAAFHRQGGLLATGLGQEAAFLAAPLPDRIQERILAAVSGGAPRSLPTVRFRVYGLVAACLILAGLVAFSTVTIRRHQQAARYGRAIADLREALIPVDVFSSIPSRPDSAVVLPDAIASPLATELAAVTEDARSAVRFVVACIAMDLSGRGGNPSPRD